jgi:bacterioferritin
MANKKALIDALNEDLAEEYGAVIQYATYAATVSGTARLGLKAFFESEIADELGHAQFLAQKIAALGGKPTTKPASVPPATTSEQMLRAVLKAETAAIQRYAKHAALAEKAGDHGLKVDLDDMIRDETSHKEETEKLLAKS